MANPKQRGKSTGKEASRSEYPSTPTSLRSSALDRVTQKKVDAVSTFLLTKGPLGGNEHNLLLLGSGC
jgi:hypothetical protein